MLVGHFSKAGMGLFWLAPKLFADFHRCGISSRPVFAVKESQMRFRVFHARLAPPGWSLRETCVYRLAAARTGVRPYPGIPLF